MYVEILSYNLTCSAGHGLSRAIDMVRQWERGHSMRQEQSVYPALLHGSRQLA